jgi:hypothetical protein
MGLTVAAAPLFWGRGARAAAPLGAAAAGVAAHAAQLAHARLSSPRGVAKRCGVLQDEHTLRSQCKQ